MGEEKRRTITHASRRVGNMMKLQSGVNYEAPPGTPVVAVHRGRVDTARRLLHYGNTIVLDHGFGMKTLYANLDYFNVRPGDCIAAGGVLARIGSSAAGISTRRSIGSSAASDGPTLHFEASDGGQFIYPLQVLEGQ